jgi:hypothetical protein
MDDWYAVKCQDIVKRGGSWILNGQYGGSFVAALQDLFPEHFWQLWKFATPWTVVGDFRFDLNFLRYLQKTFGLTGKTIGTSLIGLRPSCALLDLRIGI